MNIIYIHSVIMKHPDDLKEIFLEPLHLSGSVQEQINKNMWWIMLADEISLPDMTVEAIEKFFDNLVIAKEQQLGNQQATLYVWFDAQASQLRLNILSGIVKQLPFGAKLNIVPEISGIISNFLNLLHDDPFASENITFFDPNDESFDFDAYEEEIERNFVLDVYVKYLNEDKV